VGVTREVRERLWFGFSLGYAVIRVVGAKAFLARYGLNIVSFAIIEILSSALLAVATAGLVRSIVDIRLASSFRDPDLMGNDRYFRPNMGRVRRWAAAVVVFFAAPDVYAYAATDHLPPVLVAVLGFVLLVSAISSVVVIRRKVREARSDPSKTRPGST
jgi:hypothetical protein